MLPNHSQRPNPCCRWLARGVGRAWRFVLLLGLCSPWLQADDSPALEYKVKGAFLVKFGSFVEWPTLPGDAPQNEFTIGILGADPFGPDLDDAVKSERVKGLPVRMRRAQDLAGLAGCQVVFVSRSETARWPKLLQALAGKPILTVGEDAGFAEQGGMINLYKENGRVRFEINPAAAERSGLKLSAKLLQLGRLIAEKKTA
ncbi:MAG: YfiR family protein [Verrucomicrobia bacterium]|nr:MAG: YfiR family protein [Verrucomicrobiota bacterium]